MSDDDTDSEYSEEDLDEYLAFIIEHEKTPQIDIKKFDETTPHVRGLKWWIILIAQINYLVSRSFAIALGLTFLYECLTTLILLVKMTPQRGFLFLRLFFIIFLLILDIFIQYVFDLTFIAGHAYLYLYQVWITTLLMFIALPAFWLKLFLLVFPLAFTGLFYDVGIFSEPWVILVLGINAVAVFSLMWLVEVIDEYLAVFLYGAFWIMVLFGYYVVASVHNDTHHFQHYF